MIKTALLSLMLQAAATAEAPAPLAPAPPSPAPSAPHVQVITSLGSFTLRLEPEKAPISTANFLRYVDQKRFANTSFYRAMMVGDAGQFGLIQGGIRGSSKLALPPIKHEPTSQTGLSNTHMAISMARGAPGSANGDFFIILGDLSALDAAPADPGFAAFGQVVAGQDVVKAIQSAPVSATAGEGAMKGQMIEKPVPILSMKRTVPPAPPPAEEKMPPAAGVEDPRPQNQSVLLE